MSTTTLQWNLDKLGEYSEPRDFEVTREPKRPFRVLAGSAILTEPARVSRSKWLVEVREAAVCFA